MSKPKKLYFTEYIYDSGGSKCYLLLICLLHKQWWIQDFPGVPTAEEGYQPIILQNFAKKMHENERILTEWGHVLSRLTTFKCEQN